MPIILFVCSANRFRSVIAAEGFRYLLTREGIPGAWTIGSAGVWTRDGLPPLKEAVDFAAAHGFDLSSVRSREINAHLVAETDLILVMTQSQKESIECDFPAARGKTSLLSDAAKGEVYDIPDPVTSANEDPQGIAREVWNLIQTGFTRILQRAGGEQVKSILPEDEPDLVQTDVLGSPNPGKKKKVHWYVWVLIVIALALLGGYLLWVSPIFGSRLPKFTGEPIQTFTPLPTVNSGIVAPTLIPQNGHEQAEENPSVNNSDAVCGQKEPMIILALGIDEVEQADVIRLVRVDFTDRRALILSIPRDFWVPIPGLEDHNISQFRINAAYGYGEYFNGAGQGIVKFSETIYQNYGVTFDHYAALHFGVFEDLVDAVGGVDLYLDGPIGAYGSAGYHHLDGAAALEFAREREADLDRYRIMRQSEIIKALYQKLIQPDYLSQIPSLGLKVIRDKSVVTDFTLRDLYMFTCFAREVGKDSLVFMDVPVDMYTPMITNYGRHIKIPKPEATTYIQDLILNGNY